MVSVAYSAVLNCLQEIKALDDAKEVKWFIINELPKLAFDHKEIINKSN